MFDRVTKEMLTGAVREAQQAARREGKGFVGQIRAQVGHVKVLAARVTTMPIDEILRMHPDSFSVPLDRIRKVTVRVGDASANRPDRTVIQAAEKR